MMGSLWTEASYPHLGNQYLAKLLAGADRLAHLEAVAHAAWHLMDDSGELDTTDDNGRADYTHLGIDHDALSAMLDDLEAAGWDAHPEDQS